MTVSASSAISSTTAKQRHLYHGHGHGHASAGADNTSSFNTTATNTPLATTSSSAASSSTLSTQSLPLKHHRHGVRAHLAEFLPLPRHALFDVKLTIHQLWHVPLVSGEFSVKWKFQHVHRARRPGSSNALTSPIPMSGRLTPDSASFLSLSNGLGSGKGKGKAREVVVDNDPEHDSLMPSGASMLSTPSISEGSSSSPSMSPRTSTTGLPNDSDIDLATGMGNKNGNKSNINSFGGSGTSESSHEARGRTPYVALREHHVKWGQTVIVTVQIGIQRDTQELQPCELKLVVEQLSAPNNPLPPQNPRLGVVYLNLPEYVDKGAVTRRYLLQQSKINATLQLTLEVTHTGGETNYKAPPLRKGEVMAGVSALLENSAVGGVPRPRPVPSPAYDRSTIRPALKTHRRATDRGVFGLAGGWETPTTPMANILGVSGEMGPPTAGTGGLKTTDNLIEAIFNPVATSSPTPSPFTYYVPAGSRPSLSAATGASSSPVSPYPVAGGANASVSTNTSTRTGSGSGEVDLSAEVDGEGRSPSIAPSSARSERSVATGSSHEQDSASARSGTSANANANTGKKWWKMFSGVSSRPSSPAPSASAQPPSPATSNPSDPSYFSSNSGSGLVAMNPGHTRHYPPSVRSSPGALLRWDSDRHETTGGDEEDGEGTGVWGAPESWPAPQIVVRSPTSTTRRAPDRRPP